MAFWGTCFLLRPTLKNCLFPIHWLDEIKTSQKLPMGRSFFFAISLSERYTVKVFKKISNWYNKNVPRDIEILGWFVSSGASLTSWGEHGSLALIGNPSSGGATIKMPYGIDVLHRPASPRIFSNWVG